MVFNGITGNDIFFVAIFVWLLGVSIIVWRMMAHYNRLTIGITKKGLTEVLAQILKTQADLQSHTREIQKEIDAVQLDGRLHVQKVGMVRFNPFSDTGGSQSFTLALLDGNENGLVMTSLYARTGHRWYVKEVERGKGKELALSKEEQTAVQKANPFAMTHE